MPKRCWPPPERSETGAQAPGLVTIPITIRDFSKVCEEEKFPLQLRPWHSRACAAVLRLVSRRRARAAARLCTRSCGFEASEPIPFPGADSIFSSRCGAISGQTPFCAQALSRRDPGDRTPRFKRSRINSAGLLRNLALGTNIERLRNFGKKSIERLGVTSQIQGAFRKPLR